METHEQSAAAHSGWVRATRREDPAAGLVYGGFWVRALAWIIDAIAIGIVAGALDAITGAGRAVFVDGDPMRVWYTGGSSGLLIGVVYFVGFWLYRGQTPGMMAFGLRVVRAEDGGQIDLPRAILRYVGLVISFAVLFLGVIWAGIDERKQGWHDKIANTYVVRPG